MIVFILASSFFFSFSENLLINSLSDIQTVSIGETNLIINYESFFNL